MIPLTGRMKQYLVLRDRFGTGLSASAVRDLRRFVAFADSQGAEWVTTELFLRWKERTDSTGGQQTWSCRLSHVRSFASWLQGVDPRTEVPPRGLIPAGLQRPQPYIYTDGEIAAIVTEAARLPSKPGLRGRTYATLFGLLAVTGLRISEALGLDDGDVDTDAALLRIRHAKNDRSRVVPVTPCTIERLLEYRSRRERILGAVDTAAFFVGENLRRIGICSAEYNFAKVGQNIGLREPRAGRGRGPRLHDLRHSMAVQTIIDWHRSALDPDREMHKLSTLLGHKRPSGTYWYLEATPELLRLATERAERAFARGEES